MRFIVVGCGRTGATLALLLSQKGHQVVVVDSNSEAFWRLLPDFKGRMLTGVAFDRDLLLRAGIETADGVAAVTSNELANLVVCQLARVHFHVPRVVARLYEPERAPLYEALGVTVVSGISWRVRRLDQLLCQPTLSIVETLGNGEVFQMELRVDARLAGQSVAAAARPGRWVPLVLTRAGAARLLTPDLTLEEGDVLRLGVVAGALDELQIWLATAGKESGTCAC